MKNLHLLLFATLLSLAACGEKEDLANAIVIKACEGTFLQMENSYYQVCNEDILATVETGTKLNLNVKHLDSCDEVEPVICIGPEPLLSGDWVQVNYVY